MQTTGQQVIVAQQLIKQDIEIHAGNSVKFLFTNSEHKHYERRVKAFSLSRKRNFRHKKIPTYVLFLGGQPLECCRQYAQKCTKPLRNSIKKSSMIKER
jgi:hypothetical protein